MRPCLCVCVLLCVCVCTTCVAGEVANPIAILEEQPNGTFVVNVYAECNTTDWSILPDMRRFFNFDTRSGNVSTAIVFDFESESMQLRRECYTVSGCILARTKNNSVRVRLLDVNDNTPTFKNPQFAVEVKENAPPTSRSLPTAVDRDEEYGVRNYTLQSESQFEDLFKLTFNAHTNQLLLLVTKPLDYEARRNYSMLVIAHDGGEGETARSGQLQVLVHVSDENECEPTFDSTQYEATVRENEFPIEIFKVNATDCDSGQLLTYKLGNRANLPQPFNVTADGVVYAVEPLDFENYRNSFNGFVTVLDNGSPQRQSIVPFIIKVQDTNDNAPNLYLDFIRQADCELQFAMCIRENTHANQTVAYLEVNDADANSNDVECELQHDTPTPYLRFEKRDALLYALVSNASADREKLKSFVLSVTCVDNGAPPLTTVQNFNVAVLDVNDETPAFSQAAYRVSVIENAVLNNFTQLVASDEDSAAPNNLVTYRLVNDSSSYATAEKFYIDPKSGQISLRSRLDREAEAELQVVVIAEDGGTPTLSANTTLIIAIQDQNDCIPEFSSQKYNFLVMENQPVPLAVGQVSALDKDVGENAQLTYRLSLPGHNKLVNPDAFAINATGHVTANLQFDREFLDKVHLLVLAVDSGVPPLTGTASIVIAVADDNDNSPRLVNRPANGSLEINVVNVRNPIWKFAATDDDTGDNGKTKFEIGDFDPRICQTFLSIQPSGELHLNLPYANVSLPLSCRLDVTVTDLGVARRLSDSTTIFVKLVELEVLFSSAIILRLVGFIAMVCSTAIAITFIAILIIRLRRNAKGRKKTRNASAASGNGNGNQDEFYSSFTQPANFTRTALDTREQHLQGMVHSTCFYDELAQASGYEVFKTRTTSLLNDLNDCECSNTHSLAAHSSRNNHDQVYATNNQLRRTFVAVTANSPYGSVTRKVLGNSELAPLREAIGEDEPACFSANFPSGLPWSNGQSYQASGQQTLAPEYSATLDSSSRALLWNRSLENHPVPAGNLNDSPRNLQVNGTGKFRDNSTFACTCSTSSSKIGKLAATMCHDCINQRPRDPSIGMNNCVVSKSVII